MWLSVQLSPPNLLELALECAKCITHLPNLLVLLCASGDSCQAEMSRAVRFALWDYQTGQPLTQECDADVDAFCPKVRERC
jgi:hypothetical protein